MKTINMNGCPVTISILSQIASAIESDGGVTVINAARPINGAGIASLELGKCLEISEIDRRIRVLEANRVNHG